MACFAHIIWRHRDAKRKKIYVGNILVHYTENNHCSTRIILVNMLFEKEKPNEKLPQWKSKCHLMFCLMSTLGIQLVNTLGCGQKVNSYTSKPRITHPCEGATGYVGFPSQKAISCHGVFLFSISRKQVGRRSWIYVQHVNIRAARRFTYCPKFTGT